MAHGGYHEISYLTSMRPARVRRGRRVVVQAWETALLFRHGAHVATLGPGKYRYWRAGYLLHPIDLRPWFVLLPTQEIPTAHGVTVKATAAGRVRVTDAALYVMATRSPTEPLYLALQIALREVVAARTIEQLLTERAALAEPLLAGVRGLDQLGVAAESLELKDIVLPADIKRAQAEVLVARAQGLAAVERARGETAALRSLANAARLVADNPALYQLRLLQQLAANPGHTVVIGDHPAGTPLPAPDA